jgi:hypothetical protein
VLAVGEPPTERSANAKIRALDHRPAASESDAWRSHWGRCWAPGGLRSSTEGEPYALARGALAKRSPFATSLNAPSFDYAVQSALGQWAVEAGERLASEVLEPWAGSGGRVSAAFSARTSTSSGPGPLPEHPEDVSLLLDVFLWEGC